MAISSSSAFDEPFLQGPIVEQEVQHESRDGQNQHKQQPRDFVVRVVVGCNDANDAGDFRCPYRQIEIGDVITAGNDDADNCQNFEYRNEHGDDIPDRNVVVLPFDGFVPCPAAVFAFHTDTSNPIK